MGKPAEVYDRPANRFVAEFLGEINLLPLRDLRFEEGSACGQFEDRRFKSLAPIARSGIRHSCHPPRALDLG